MLQGVGDDTGMIHGSAGCCSRGGCEAPNVCSPSLPGFTYYHAVKLYLIHTWVSKPQQRLLASLWWDVMLACSRADFIPSRRHLRRPSEHKCRKRGAAVSPA